jgi:hypothetical protein
MRCQTRDPISCFHRSETSCHLRHFSFQHKHQLCLGLIKKFCFVIGNSNPPLFNSAMSFVNRCGFVVLKQGNVPPSGFAGRLKKLLHIR